MVFRNFLWLPAMFIRRWNELYRNMCVFGDLEIDGVIDILIINLKEPSLLRKDLRGTTNHWIKVKLEGAKSNRSGIGARVLVHYGNKTQAQAVLSQSSFFPATTRVCTSEAAIVCKAFWR